MTLTRLALAGLLVAGTLVLATVLLASLSDERRQASSDVTADEPMLSPALDGPQALSMVTCVVPAGFGDLSAVPAPAERRCSEHLLTPSGFETPTVTEC